MLIPIVKRHLRGFQGLIAHSRLPVKHRKTTRADNLLEHLLEEERRRTRAISHRGPDKELEGQMKPSVKPSILVLVEPEDDGSPTGQKKATYRILCSALYHVSERMGEKCQLCAICLIQN